ncbi:carboxymuconolactone decarboxylase family protein, partial [Streptomyces calidiresistens]|uniref:carboxymuconolactone decarboxylase family protein n=1 Tax=Streptomyces calidiresistens TaxID=1485586 RepID=UPI002B1F584B
LPPVRRPSPTLRLASLLTRLRFGRVLAPVSAVGRHPRVLRTLYRLETGAQRWNSLDPALKHLAVMAAAARINCSWCLDFGHWHAERLGLPMETIRHVPVWRDHRDLFSHREALVLEYAEAMCETPPRVGDGLVAALRDELGDRALVELTAMVSLENLRSRTYLALGLTSQGFSADCAVPPLPARRGPSPEETP